MRVTDIGIRSLGIHLDSQREVARVDGRRHAAGEPRQLLRALRPRPAGLGRVPRQPGLLGDHAGLGLRGARGPGPGRARRAGPRGPRAGRLGVRAGVRSRRGSGVRSRASVTSLEPVRT